jgi:hypothetical protein
MSVAEPLPIKGYACHIIKMDLQEYRVCWIRLAHEQWRAVLYTVMNGEDVLE